MNRIAQYGIILAAVGVAGCGGSNGGSSSYGGYDSSLNPPGSPLSGRPTAPGAIPNVATWPAEDGKALLIKVVAFTSVGLYPSKAGEKNSYDVKAIDSALADISDLGYNVVQVDAFPGNHGLKLSKEGSIVGVEDEAVKNLSDLAERARAHKLKLLISLNDGFSGIEKSPITDKKLQEVYAKSVLAPIARKLKARDGVFGFELDSALEADANSKEASSGWESARTFLKSAADAVKREDPQRLIGSGPVSIASLQPGKMIASGMDFYLLAIPAGSPLPDPNALKLDRPVMIEQSAEKSVEPQSVKNFVRDADLAKYSGFGVGTYSTRPEDEEHSLVDRNGKRRPIADAVKAALSATQQQIQPPVPPVQHSGG